MKEFYGYISFSGRINFVAEAISEEEVKDLVYDNITMDIESDKKDVLEIAEVEWDLISEAPRGNIATNFVHNFEIFEED